MAYSEGMKIVHINPHPLAGKRVRIKAGLKHMNHEAYGGTEFRLEDWWDRVAGKPWRYAVGNPACLVYGIHRKQRDLPEDDEVLYGKIGGFGYLVHISEIEEVPEATS